jgi:hypothetical protein
MERYFRQQAPAAFLPPRNRGAMRLRRIIQSVPKEGRRQLALELVTRCRAPSRAGVVATSAFLTAAPLEALPIMLRAAWDMQVSRAAWSLALTQSWLGTSPAVVEAAGTIDELRRWFATADQLNPLPFLRPLLLSTDDLPEIVTLYRGASTARPYTDAGFSWSPHRNVAAWYADWRVRKHGGSPVVHRATVSASGLALATRPPGAELVCLDQPEATLDTRDPAEIRRLAGACKKQMLPMLHTNQIQLNLAHERCWAGWDGD